MEQEFSAGLIIYILEDDAPVFLLLHYQAGHWDFPKGHIEKGESKKDAALRELQEETGLSADIIDDWQEEIEYFFYKPFMHTAYGYNTLVQKKVYFFLGLAKSNQVNISHEHIDYAWLPYKKAVAKLTYSNAQEILKKAFKFLKNNN